MSDQEPTAAELKAELEAEKKARQDDARAHANALSERDTRLARIEGEMKALKETGGGERPREVSDAEIDKLVDAGKLTTAEAQAYRSKRLKGEVLQHVDSVMQEFHQTASRTAQIDGEIGRYLARVPDAQTQGTEQHGKLKDEFDYLTQIEGPIDDGDALAVKTRTLKALRAAFGPADRIPDTTRENLETHRETGGGAGAGDKQTPSAPTARGLGINQGYYDLLKSRIDNGEFTGFDDPKVKRLIERAKQRPQLAA